MSDKSHAPIHWLGDCTDSGDLWELTRRRDRFPVLGNPTTLYFKMDDGTNILVPSGWWIYDWHTDHPRVSSAAPAPGSASPPGRAEESCGCPCDTHPEGGCSCGCDCRDADSLRAALSAALERAEAAEAERDRLREQRDRWRNEKLAGEGPLWDQVLEAEARESALREAVRGLAEEWADRAATYDAESEKSTKNDDERRTALAKFIASRALRDCVREVRARALAGAEKGDGR